MLLLTAAVRSKATPSIPPIAKLCGIQVGYDTMERLEAILGAGLPQLGGHPLGARLWRAPALGIAVWADGFYYNDKDGRVADHLWIGQWGPASPDDIRIPIAHLLPAQARFLGAVTLGMTRRQVVAALGSRLPPPRISRTQPPFAPGDDWTWTSPGFFRFNALNHNVVRSWTATLTFRRGKLDVIDIDADVDGP